MVRSILLIAILIALGLGGCAPHFYKVEAVSFEESSIPEYGDIVSSSWTSFAHVGGELIEISSGQFDTQSNEFVGYGKEVTKAKLKYYNAAVERGKLVRTRTQEYKTLDQVHLHCTRVAIDSFGTATVAFEDIEEIHVMERSRKHRIAANISQSILGVLGGILGFGLIIMMVW